MDGGGGGGMARVLAVWVSTAPPAQIDLVYDRLVDAGREINTSSD